MNVGVSLDGVYDRSANYPYEDYGYPPTFPPAMSLYRPSASSQMALGLSARLEVVMPYFTINLRLRSQLHQ